MESMVIGEDQSNKLERRIETDKKNNGSILKLLYSSSLGRQESSQRNRINRAVSIDERGVSGR